MPKDNGSSLPNKRTYNGKKGINMDTCIHNDVLQTETRCQRDISEERNIRDTDDYEFS